MRSLNWAFWVCCGAATFGCGGNEAAKNSDTASVAGSSGGGSGAGTSRAGDTSVATSEGGAGANGGSATASGGGATASTSTTACVNGTERCDCYGNGTCNAGLTCASGLCVVVGVISTSGGTTSTTTAGGSANAGATASGGTASGGAAKGGATPGGAASGGTSATVGGDALAALFRSCGNSSLDTNEQCDDGNIQNGDGCTRLCQVELDWVCSGAGRLCVPTVVCGDGKLASVESCDDGNTNDDDGCSSDCKAVADGYQCRTPGKRCVPICGDSKLTGLEKCDDGNTDSGDGCSSTCLTEPGFSCSDSPSSCNLSICGNGVKEPGEGCDKGVANGLFYADGQGCSKTCTQEPNCRPGGVTQACSTVCGDGNVDLGEECDDGNAAAGDGCADNCKKESGFNCTDAEVSVATNCADGTGNCLILPVTYRDFEGQQVAGGHPDFFYYGASASGGRTTGVVSGATATTCIPNASGTKVAAPANGICPNSDAAGPCLGLVSDRLGSDGKPVYAKGTCPCMFTDWDKTGLLGTCPASGTASCTPSKGISGVQDCWVSGEGSHRLRVDSTVTVIQSAESFKQWYSDSSSSTTVKGTLELAALGDNQYQFRSSNGRTTADDVHDIFMATGVVSSLSSGFFPLEDQSRTKVCNLWPYWLSGLATNCVANAGNPVVSQWDPLGSFTAGIAGTGGPIAPVTGVRRNFYFTSEVRYLFRYSGISSSLAFYGDDDVWIFINGKLALDLGAPHERLQGSVAVDAAQYALELGKIYEIAVFHADRQPRESNYELTVPGNTKTRSTCAPNCGDGVVTSGEDCDDGANNKPASDAYGACTTTCKLGPYCGDGEVTGAEACDNGVRNGAPYGTAAGCTNGCEKVHYCGDRIIDGAFGEECDGGAVCAADCKLVLSSP